MPDRSRPSEGSWTAEALATGRLQRLRPSMPAAGDLVNRARMHLRSAGLIADNDPTLAMSACHDAARQAISAHMRATGYRATAEAGAHRLVIEYASVVLAGVISEDDVVALDELRRDRHIGNTETSLHERSPQSGSETHLPWQAGSLTRSPTS